MTEYSALINIQWFSTRLHNENNFKGILMKKMIITMALLLVSAVSIAENVTDIPEITAAERDLLSSNYANVTLYKLLERSHVKDHINVVTVANGYPNSQCAKALRTVLYGHHKDAIYAVNLLN